MTIAEYIEQLKQLPQNMLVIKLRENHRGHYRWESMDGWWPQEVRVVHSGNSLDSGSYYEPRESDEREIITALEI